MRLTNERARQPQCKDKHHSVSVCSSVKRWHRSLEIAICLSINLLIYHLSWHTHRSFQSLILFYLSILSSMHLSFYPLIHLSVHCPSINLHTHPPLCKSHLFLAEYEDAAGFDGMPGSQTLSPPFHLSSLVGLPHAVPQGPANTDVLPLVLWER